MKIYLAARYTRYLELQQPVRDLLSLGHTVTSEWLLNPYNNGDNGYAFGGDDAYVQSEAERDIQNVRDSDMLIVFSEDEGHLARGGKHVEFGIALALGKRLAVVGRKEVLFHYLPNVEVYSTWQAALEAL